MACMGLRERTERLSTLTPEESLDDRIHDQRRT
jgi:hypothetical protein